MRSFFLALAALLIGCTGDAGGNGAGPGLAPAPKRISITIDDLPFADRTASFAQVRRSNATILHSLRRHRVKAVGFVNEDRLADTGRPTQGIRLLEQWLDAGMELGNHNYGHVGFHDTPLQAYQEAVLRGERETKRLVSRRGQKLRYYRHPFTQTGPDAASKAAFERFLAERGYAVAPFTIEHDDYMFSAVYDDALRRGDNEEAARLRVAYLAHLDDALSAFETMSGELFGRQISHVLLIHTNRLNADTLDQTLERLRARGYTFTTLEQALLDPAYASPDGYIGSAGPSWLLRWARGLRKRTSVGGQPDPESWIQDRYREVTAQSR